MVKKPFRGNYLELKVRVSYDKKTDTVHLTSKDKDLQAERGFHMTLNGGRDAEYILRELLEREGMIPKDKSRILPDRAFFGDSPSHKIWNHFPLGLDGNDEEVIWDPTVAPHILLAGSCGSGKSVVQRNIIFHCIQNSDKWSVIGIDLKQVELSPYKKYDSTVESIATTFEEAFEAIEEAHQRMFDRYEVMEKQGVNNYQDLVEAPRALMLVIDEAYVLLAPIGRKTLEQEKEEPLREIMSKKLEEIARLGRAAGIHLSISSQRPDAKILHGEFKQNLSARLAMGRMSPPASAITLDNDQATKIHGAVKGRGYFQEFGEGAYFQAYFAPSDWLDEWLLENQ
jgi:S-DNA-T family DNA segregation ATPase FtsK/SpoIIIE